MRPGSSPSSSRRPSGRSSPRISTRPAPPPSCAARCAWIRCWPRHIASWDSRSSPWGGSGKRCRAGMSGSVWSALPTKRRSGPWCSARAKRRRCSAMADDIRELSAQLAQDPQSLVFLRLGEALRRKGQLDGALRVAVNGLERHPHLADAHDLYARILTDKHDYERAFDEWDMAVRIAPHHTGALKGLAFLYFKVGDLAQAEAHLEQARKVEPDDPSIDQAIAMMRKGTAPPAPTAATAESAPALASAPSA